MNNERWEEETDQDEELLEEIERVGHGDVDGEETPGLVLTARGEARLPTGLGREERELEKVEDGEEREEEVRVGDMVGFGEEEEETDRSGVEDEGREGREREVTAGPDREELDQQEEMEMEGMELEEDELVVTRELVGGRAAWEDESGEEDEEEMGRAMVSLRRVHFETSKWEEKTRS